MNKKTTFRPGEQVAYTPNHLDKPSQFGFVTSIDEKSGDAFVRYWKQEDPKSRDDLQTRGDSERTPKHNLDPFHSVPDDWVHWWMVKLQYWKE